MLNLQNVDVARQLARERETALRGRTSLLVSEEHSRRRVRRWVGRQLVRTGVWLLANETPTRPVRVR